MFSDFFATFLVKNLSCHFCFLKGKRGFFVYFQQKTLFCLVEHMIADYHARYDAVICPEIQAACRDIATQNRLCRI